MSFVWKKRTAFAEFADALGIDSDQIMAALQRHPNWIVLYTVNTDTPDAVVWKALLRRDQDGILRMIDHQGLCPLSEFMPPL